MSARDDYPPLHASSGSAELTRELMCDEIDALRRERTGTNRYRDWLEAEIKSKDAVRKALDELISTLTTHADAMCALLIRVRDGDRSAMVSGTMSHAHWTDLNEAIKAYDDFVKEC